MSNRLNIAKKLLSDEGIIFISIDDNEYSQLKLLCDEIFGENNFVGNIVWEKRTKCQNTKTAKYMLQSKTEFILVYKNKETKYEFVLDFEAKRKYPDLDEKGEKYRLEKIGEMSASGIRGRETMIFDIEGIYPKKGNQWKYGRETVEKFKKRGDLVIKNKKAYFRIRECDEEEKMKPFWSLLLKDIGTAESAKVELNNILKTKQHGFETVKPVNLIKNLIYHVVGENPNATILDFFAGSGTTGQAVLELNQEDNGNRKFILCTNNENNICRNITYERLYKIINGYSNSKGKKIVGTPSNLKYYKTKYIDKYILPNDEIELSDELMENIKELVMLENNIYIDNKKIKIAFSEEQLEEMLKDTGTIEKIYISSDILITNKQEEIINDAKIEIIDIPEYYYREEIED